MTRLNFPAVDLQSLGAVAISHPQAGMRVSKRRQSEKRKTSNERRNTAKILTFVLDVWKSLRFRKIKMIRLSPDERVFVGDFWEPTDFVAHVPG
jgi:hypothetical protein